MPTKWLDDPKPKPARTVRVQIVPPVLEEKPKAPESLPVAPVVIDHGVNRFVRSGAWGRTGKQGTGANGAPLCSCGCGVECRQRPVRQDGKPGAFYTTATATCHDKWAAIHDPGTVRRRVERRDKGVCAECKRDTDALKRKLTAELQAWRGNWRTHGPAPQPPAGFPDLDRHWWEADHVIPVIEGGGCCALEGYRTLCLPCHKTATAALAKRLADKRRAAKGQIVLELA